MRILIVVAILWPAFGSLVASSRAAPRSIISSPIRRDLLKSFPPSDGLAMEKKIRTQPQREQQTSTLTNIPNLMSIARMLSIPAFLALRFSDQVRSPCSGIIDS
jgi:hypothetical protein